MLTGTRARLALRFSGQEWRAALADVVSLRDIGMFGILAASYFVSGKLGLKVAFINPSATALWAPAGISLAAFLMLGYRVWPAILAGAFLVNVTTTGSMVTSLAIAIGNTLEGVAGAYLINRFAGGLKAFSTPRDILRFAAAGVLASSIGATIGVGVLCRYGLANWSDAQSVWLTWWVGDVLGVLAVTPFLVLLFRSHHHLLSFAEWCEITALLVGLSITCIINFGPPARAWSKGYPPLFVCLPFLVWVVLRFCPLEAAGAALVVGGFASWGSLHGYGPLAENTHPPLLLAGYVAVMSTMTLTVAAAVAQRREMEENLLGMQSVLRAMIERKSCDLDAVLDSLQAEAVEHMETKQALQESNRRLLQLTLHVAGGLRTEHTGRPRYEGIGEPS
jgi:integral membrane sensor domain MASE1